MLVIKCIVVQLLGNNMQISIVVSSLKANLDHRKETWQAGSILQDLQPNQDAIAIK